MTLGFVAALQQYRSFGATLEHYKSALNGLDSAFPDEVAPVEDKITFILANHPWLALQALLALYLVAAVSLIKYAKLPSKVFSSLKDQSFCSAMLISGIDVLSSLRSILAEARDNSEGDDSFFETIRKGVFHLLLDQPSLVITHCLLGLLYLRKVQFGDVSLIPFSLPYLVLSIILIAYMVSPATTRNITSKYNVFQSPWSGVKRSVSGSNASEKLKQRDSTVDHGDAKSFVKADESNVQSSPSSFNEAYPQSAVGNNSPSIDNEQSSVVPEKKSRRKKKDKTKMKNKKTTQTSASVSILQTPLYTLQGICDVVMMILEIYFFYHLLLMPQSSAVNGLTITLDSLRMILSLLYLYRRVQSLRKLKDLRSIVNIF
ncbi:hypothetical protein EON65_19605 [archaeon]|nr:MAG: hypothetical protein EON65_19605 [archaeon]